IYQIVDRTITAGIHSKRIYLISPVCYTNGKPMILAKDADGNTIRIKREEEYLDCHFTLVSMESDTKYKLWYINKHTKELFYLYSVDPLHETYLLMDSDSIIRNYTSEYVKNNLTSICRNKVTEILYGFSK